MTEYEAAEEELGGQLRRTKASVRRAARALRARGGAAGSEAARSIAFARQVRGRMFAARCVRALIVDMHLAGGGISDAGGRRGKSPSEVDTQGGGRDSGRGKDTDFPRPQGAGGTRQGWYGDTSGECVCACMHVFAGCMCFGMLQVHVDTKRTRMQVRECGTRWRTWRRSNVWMPRPTTSRSHRALCRCHVVYMHACAYCLVSRSVVYFHMPVHAHGHAHAHTHTLSTHRSSRRRRAARRQPRPRGESGRRGRTRRRPPCRVRART